MQKSIKPRIYQNWLDFLEKPNSARILASSKIINKKLKQRIKLKMKLKSSRLIHKIILKTKLNNLLGKGLNIFFPFDFDRTISVLLIQ